MTNFSRIYLDKIVLYKDHKDNTLGTEAKYEY